MLGGIYGLATFALFFYDWGQAVVNLGTDVESNADTVAHAHDTHGDCVNLAPTV